MADQPLNFTGDFDKASDEAWRALVEKALAGRDFDKVMAARTYDDIRIDGLSTQATMKQAGRPDARQGPWGVMAPHWNPDVAATNRAVLEDLERGATGVALRLQSGRFPGVRVEDMAAALEGVYLNMASFTLIPGEEFASASSGMLQILGQRDDDKADIHGNLGCDPIGTLAQTGRLKTSADDAVAEAAGIAKNVSDSGWRIETFMVDSGAYHMAGGTEAQELGLLIATGVAYLRALEAAGLPIERAAGQIGFSMAADADVSMTIAKFRAARLMWAAILRECGVEKPAPMKLNAVSSLRMMTVKDPWVNILRGTAACFGAGVAGADSVCVLPHDSMLGMSSSFARRIARNIQIILQEESGLSRVVDPAAGSYAFETITSDLADKAWEYFRKIESAGGVLSALRGGAVQQNLQSAWALRRRNVARRKDPITGVSEFPSVDEKPLSNVGDMPSEPAGMPAAGEQMEPVSFHRLAEDFEKLRYYSDACLEKNGERPKVFLANIGSAADFTARSTFAKNFFEAGGVVAVTGQGGIEPSGIVDEFRSSGARLAVLCSSDGLYQAHAASVAAALNDAGAFLYLAGRPENGDELRNAGVQAFIYVGCDVLEVLAQAHVVTGENA